MPAVIDAEQAAWIVQAGPTITVASVNATLCPSLGQGVGIRIDAGRERLTLFMVESRSAAVIADLRAGRALAVVFTHATSLRSLQLKALSAREVPLLPGDQERIVSYVGAVTLQWTSIGMPDDYIQALLPRGPGPILAFEMTPHVAFDQTPGPRAGVPLLSPA